MKSKHSIDAAKPSRVQTSVEPASAGFEINSDESLDSIAVGIKTPTRAEELPLVSVIVPTYNRAGIIGKTLENIFQQTYPNIEVIVIDDGSTDDTISVLKSYGDRIRWAAQANAGPAAARNHGIAISKGEIIAFQDSDDVSHPARIERQVALLQKAGESVVCCICNTAVQYGGGMVISSFDIAPVTPPIEEGIWLNVFEVLATRFIMFNQAAVVRREVLTRIGGFDEFFRVLEDMDLELRLSLEGPWAFIREPLATRQHVFARSQAHECTEDNSYEYPVKIQEAILRRIDNDSQLAGLRPFAERELRRLRRQLRAVRMRDAHSWGTSLIGWGLVQIERYSNALYRRTPWYPVVRVSRIESWNP